MTLWHISFHKNVGKWQATLSHEGKIYHIGYFTHKADAVVAQNLALTSVYGSLATAWASTRPKRRSRSKVTIASKLDMLIQNRSGGTQKAAPVVVISASPPSPEPAKPLPLGKIIELDDLSLLKQFEDIKVDAGLIDLV